MGRLRAALSFVGLGALLGVLLSAAPSPAQAAPPSLRPGTNPWFFDAGVGWAIDVDGYGGSQVKFVQELGYHFRGDASGPALGVAVAEGVGNGFFTFQSGAKFWWDIQPVSDLGLYIAPFGVAGLAIATNGGGVSGFFNFQFGGQVKLVINDQWNVWVRPFAFDFFAGDSFAVRYDFLAGGVITF